MNMLSVTDRRPGRRAFDSPRLWSAPWRVLRPATLWLAAVLLLGALAGCRMSHVEAAKQPPGPAQPGGSEEPATQEMDGTPADQPGAPFGSPDGSPELAIAPASAAESDGVLRFTVSLSGAGGAAVTVAYETEEGTARVGTDYVVARGRLTFAAESTAAQRIEVRLLDDEVDESGETMTVRLSDPRGATLAAATATGTIHDDDARALAVEPPELYVTEGESATYEVTLGSRPTATVNVTVTAADAAELTIAPERLEFTPARWEDAQTVTLTAEQDSDALADVPVQLAHTASGGGYDGVAAPVVTVTIVEDDVPTLAMAPAQASERSGRIAFAVTLSQASDEVVTVNYATDSSGGTATEGVDYTPASGTLRFPARSTAAQTFEVTVNNDSMHEDTEVFTVTLRNAENAQLAGGGDTLTAAGRIEDEDQPPKLSIGNGSVTEGPGSGPMQFAVQLVPASGRTVTVQYGTADVTATGASDYTAVSGTLTFLAGTAVRTVPVPIADDALDEPDEQFTVSLQAAVNATVATAAGTGTIADNDDAPELSIGSARLTEGSGGGAMPFAVQLVPVSGRTVTVEYATVDGSAAAGADYTAASGTLTFRAGSTSRTIAVAIVDDTLDEPEEQFTVTLRAPVNATVGGAPGTGTIADNDQASELNIADGSLTEGAGSMPFVVRLDPASGSVVTVDYATADGSATSGADYKAASGALTFAADATTATVEVAILDDTTAEDPETFTVTLSNAAGATLADASADGTITDNDDSTITDPGNPPNTVDSTPPELSSLAVTGGGTLYPAFDAGTLHYALTCDGSPTLSVAAETERDGAQLTLLRADSADHAVSTTGTLNASVTVDGDHDVAIEVSDDDNTTTYVVHCLPAAFPTVNILTKTEQVKDGLLLLTPTYGGYHDRVTFMAVLDNNGVPRFHRLLTDANFWAMNFRPHGGGRFSVARRPLLDLSDSAFGTWQIDLLDNQFEVTSTVATVSPLSHTDGHDFQITSAGDYVMLSSYDDVPRDFSAHGGSENEEVADSVIQRRTAAGVSQFTWNSWDHKEVLQWGNDCKVGLFLAASSLGPPAYAHLNSLQLLADGDFVGSFRGCSQVLRIDGSTGAVEWKLGGTPPPEDVSPPEDSDAEFLELVEHSESDVIEEFCGPHHVTLTSSNTVVMYDNGVQCIGPRKDSAPFSRAVEYDISSGTQAEYEREYHLPASHGYFPYRGGVHVLEDFGGTVHWLISWGGRATNRTVAVTETIAVSEVDPDGAGTAHLEVNMYKGSLDAWSYRAYRVPESEVDIPLNLP